MLKRSYLKRTKGFKKPDPFKLRSRLTTNGYSTTLDRPRYVRRRSESAVERKWKREARERDNYACRWPDCGYSSRHIHVHHIHTRAQRPDLKWEVSNGACLCQPHHDRLHHTVEGRQAGRELGLLGTETYEKAQKDLAA